jgi:hypothetical protein
VCIYSLTYPACTAHSPYYIVTCDLSGGPCFSTLSHKRLDFREKSFEHTMCFDFRDNFCPKHFSFWEEIIQILSQTFVSLHDTCIYPLFLSDFNETWIFSTDFRKILICQILGIPAQWKPGVLCRRTDRPTDTTKLIVAFRNFANAPKDVKCRVFRWSKGLLSLLVTKHLAVVGRISQTFFTLKVPAILRVLLKEGKGSVTIEEDCQSKSAASHPVVNKFA